MLASTATSRPVAAAHIEARDVSKRYEGIVALDRVSLAIAAGTVHALVGENGAGKSTLGKIFGGVVQPDGGALLLNGQEVSFKSPRDALNAGIALVHQEIAVAPALSVIQNVFLGAEVTRAGFVRSNTLRRRFRELMDETGFDLAPDVKASALRVADQQKVEVVRALARDAKLIVLDEPTAALTLDESSRLLDIVRLLRSRGTTVIYVSHDLEEVLSIADTVTVLKDGQRVSTCPASEESVGALVTKMLGRRLETMFPPKRVPSPDAPVVMRVDGLSRTGILHDISFEIRAGEIVGIAGLVGSGRTELARAIFGADPVESGTVELDGRFHRFTSPSAAVRNGVALVPESRKEQGLVMNASVSANLTLAALSSVTRNGWIIRRAEQRTASRVAEEVDVRMRGLDQTVALLSGGNQQKVALGKWLVSQPKLLIVDEPTRGVDVGARSTIYELLAGLAERGLAVLLISSELEEVMGMAHRILVMRRGRIAAQLPGDAAENTILHAAFGSDQSSEERV